MVVMTVMASGIVGPPAYAQRDVIGVGRDNPAGKPSSGEVVCLIYDKVTIRME